MEKNEKIIQKESVRDIYMAAMFLSKAIYNIDIEKSFTPKTRSDLKKICNKLLSYIEPDIVQTTNEIMAAKLKEKSATEIKDIKNTLEMFKESDKEEK